MRVVANYSEQPAGLPPNRRGHFEHRIRRDWKAARLDVMRKAIWPKFTQHAALEDLLLSTGDSALVERTGWNDFWGDGGDGDGQNWLGRILQETRTRLRRDCAGTRGRQSRRAGTRAGRVMSSQVELTIGDILVEEADVIVNAANTDMIMGGGVARDILNEAGAEIEDEAMAQAPVAVGDVVVTSAGNLAAQHILHVAVVGGAEPDLYECTRNVLESAAELGAESLALPALGTGSAGVPPSVAAPDICQALKDYIDETGSDMQVRLVVYEDGMYGAFDKAMRQVFNLPG